MSDSKTKTIKVSYLARVEGEGALHVRMRKGKVEDVQLKIFEPPRFFEAFLRGRNALEAPDITARICGICPVAYQMSAVHAVEHALGVTVTEPLRDLRRLLYCGEWIESHILHVYMLHAPDFLGFPDAIGMAKSHQKEVQMGLAIKKAGNSIVSVVGGREVHPINVKVGGFHRAPRPGEVRTLLDPLQRALAMAVDTVRWVAGFSFPDFEREPEFVALRHPTEYPMCEGRVGSSQGIDIDAVQFDDQFVEIHVPYTNALHAVVKGRGSYLTGPLARFNLNRSLLATTARGLADEFILESMVKNPFKSIIIRSIEIVHALEESIRMVENYRETPASSVPFTLHAGEGAAVTEAPRGLLYHRYRLSEDGTILDAKIIPPTSQNQKSIEDDLRDLLPSRAALPKGELTHLCEQAIRNHDPCISCATHFLRLEIHDVEPSDATVTP